MILLDFYKNKRVGVVGLGKTGQSVIDSLIASGAEVRTYDDFDTAHGSNLKISDLNERKLHALIVSPGINVLWPNVHLLVRTARRNFIPVLNDIDLFQKHVPGIKNICATGTNGKSTTVALINHILNFAGKKAAIGGNFGRPVLSLDADCDFFVLELSSYQLESCNILGFDTAILLNITPDHLTRHGGIEGYISSKQKIFANFHEKSTAIIGVDDDYCNKIFEFLKSVNHLNTIPISGQTVPRFGIGWDNDSLIDNHCNSYEAICKKNQMLDGGHNRQNIAASYAACIVNGIDRKSFCEGLSSFNGLEHRQEILTDIDGVLYVNDSKATNVESTKQAMMRFDNIIWILGGRPKENGIECLAKYFRKVKFAFLIGEAAENWSLLLTKHGVKNKIVKTLDVAVDYSRKASNDYSSDVVLLSPACASFDQFKSFEDRGNQFKKLVYELKERKK